MNARVVAHHIGVRPEGPEAEVVVTDNAGVSLARCSLWWRRCPELPGERLGFIGQYHRESNLDAASLVLKTACERLREVGCTLAVGPLDGSTSQPYRFIVERGTEPPFFMEPDHPDQWVDDFRAADFSVLAEYTSALNSDLTRIDVRLARAETRLAEHGVTLRQLRRENYVDDLRYIFQVSHASFVRNFLYASIEEETFLAQYLPLQEVVRPELVLLAFQGEQPVGFVFAVPDLAEQRRGEVIKTAVLKTVAAVPGRAFAGLGNLLVGAVQAAARECGYTRVIHALMHESNNSKNLSGRYATTFRRYALFRRPLRSS